MDGKVAKAVRERKLDVPLLFIPGCVGTAPPVGSDVIDKPFDLDTPIPRVRTA